MKRFSELNYAQQFEVIASIQELSEKFEQRAYESEIEFYTMGKINGLNCVDYSIGVCNRNYLCIKNNRYTGEVEKSDANAFLCSLENVVKMYGCSQRCEKQIAKCNKLYDSNLFVYECKRLCEMYFEDDILPEIEWVEKFGYNLYCKNFESELTDVLIQFLDEFDLDNDFFFDESDEKWCYKEVIIYRAA